MVDGDDGSGLLLAQRRTQELSAEQIGVERSLIGRVRGRAVELRQSATGVALGRTVRLRQAAGSIVGGARVDTEQTITQWLVGGVVHAKQVFAVAVIAGKVEGQVRCLFDARGAFAFGAGAGLVMGLLRLVGRRR